ncbi:MAG: wax ester/triacylglycerol synthase domain-containing protein, partial [Micropruina sp.]
MTRAGRLSALDAIFLPMETETQALHVGSVLLLDGPAPDPALFRDLIGASLVGLPIHRRRVMRMPLDLGRPIWVDAENFEPERHLRHAALEAPGSESQFTALVAQIMAPRLDAARPLWELWHVDGLSGGRWAVVVKAHHTMVDGQSGADLVASLLSGAPSGPLRLLTVPEPLPAPTAVRLGVDLVEWLAMLPVRAIRLGYRSLRDPREARRRVAQVRFGLAQVIRPDLPPSVLSGPLGPRRIWGWTGVDLAFAVRVTRSAHCTLNDVFLAALAGGYRRFLLDRGEPLDAMVL